MKFVTQIDLIFYLNKKKKPYLFYDKHPRKYPID